MSEIKPDHDKSLEFLRRWNPHGPWVLTAIIPDPPKSGPKTFTDTFTASDEAGVRAWLEEHGTQKHHNVYFTVNPLSRAVTVKPSREHIAALSWIHVDLDPRVGEDIDAERVRILALLRDPCAKGLPPPTCIVFSGGGYQGFWRLSNPMLLDSSAAKYEEAKLYNKQVELLLGGDNCHNVDRIMRLPGSINWPNKKKREKNRVPALAELIEWPEPERVCDRKLFEKAPAAATTAKAEDGAPVVEISGDVRRFDSVDDIPELRDRPQCRVVIVQGLDPDEPKKHPSRSEWQHYACCEMVRAGCSDDTIYSVLTDPAFGVSKTVLEKGRGVRAYAVRQIERARATVVAEVEELQKDKDGKPYKNLHNARLAIKKLGVTLEFDEFAERSLISGLPGFGPHLDDAAVTRLRFEIDERFKLPFAKEWLTDLVTDLARRNRRHPVREFLDGLRWDETPRLDGWLSGYLGVPESDYTRAVGRLVLIAAVRRIREPGCKFDEMLVLEGPQGGLKSTALAALAMRPDWFSDDLPLNAKAQQFIEATLGKWIVEAGELKGMTKGDVESLKSCLSRSFDRSRMAYAHLPIERARQFVIIGTTNSDRYLRDNTGNRRFWPVKVGAVSLDDLRRDREQLWAEAAAREAEGASIRLDPMLYGAAAHEQESRRVEDPFLQVLGDALNGMEGKLRTADAWAIVGVAPGQRQPEHNLRLSDAMRELGWERKKLRFGDGPEWAYVKGNERVRLEVFADAFGRVTSVEPARDRETNAAFGGPRVEDRRAMLDVDYHAEPAQGWLAAYLHARA